MTAFKKGYDPRRAVNKPKPEKPKRQAAVVTKLIGAGVPKEEAEQRVAAGQFKPGHDPRRPFNDPAKLEEWRKTAPRPKVARAAARMAWYERLPWLAGVIDGEPQARVVRKWIKDEKMPNGGYWKESEFFETPDVEDRLKAMQQLGEMAGVKTMSVTDGDDETPPVPHSWQLSNLTAAQLLQLRELALAARPQRGLKELAEGALQGVEVKVAGT